MTISLLLEMAVSGNPDRLALVSDDVRLTVGELNALADGCAGALVGSGPRTVAYVGTGGVMLPLLIFASARAALPFSPLNYRLSGEALRELIDRLDEPLVVCDSEYRDVAEDAATKIIESQDLLSAARTSNPVSLFPDPDDVAVLLFTSGTTSRPKAVELSHNNLTGYVTGTVEFDSAAPDDAVLICVPPYHIAGVSAALSNLYAGRKMVYQRNFEPKDWIRLVNAESVTNATVVPTMLNRIVTELERNPVPVPTLRSLAYGGSKVAPPLLRKALELLPDVGFVNAYGLTETSSTIAVLTAQDHRAAQTATDEMVRKRLASVGQPVPGIEVEIRGDDGEVLDRGQVGELFVRGPQVSGRYAEIGSVLDENGWFPTRDSAMLDQDGYLFITGRADDTIIRGGENVAPAEVEDVLVEHPAVREVAVVGIEDPEWGQIIAAVVVPEYGTTPDPEELRDHVRKALRGSRTPDRVVFRQQLPVTPTGKVLRRELVNDLTGERAGR
ncbi:MAG: long-chain fatty acid--CoA ligase [Mycobacteriaceae bacterium]|nr:long-chain fatty acid--CoA ligase [Mycobacteriaceae bacterium]MBV9639220.1 long-chain fatty acid--CoA ligase [Mycobacteriaceae bacterium]